MPTKRCCCGGRVCTECTNVTWFSVSGLSNPDCTGGCDNKNGTYVFRTVGAAIPVNCTWCSKPWSGNNCGLDDDPLMYVGDSYPCSAATGYCVLLSNVTGGVKVRVEITLNYLLTPTDVFLPPDAFRYRGAWEKTFSRCSEIGGALDFVGITKGDCEDINQPGQETSGNDPGDLCDLAGATVSIG